MLRLCKMEHAAPALNPVSFWQLLDFCAGYHFDEWSREEALKPKPKVAFILACRQWNRDGQV